MHPSTRSLSRLVGAAALAVAFAAPVSAQVNYSFDFDTDAAGWGGNFSRFTGTSTCGGTGGAMRRNMYSGATSGELISPLVGTSFGGQVTLTYDYKVAQWSANTVGAATPWGGFDVQYGPSASGPWTTFASVVDEAQTGSCLPQAHVFTPPAGDLYIRFACTWTGGDNYYNFDNIALTEVVTPCSGTPAPGDTTGPASACSGANFVLGLQNATAGTGVSYQWYASTVGSTGPWTPVGGDSATLTTSQTATTWYYCDVTCSDGPSTGSSNVLQVDVASAAFPQDWDAGQLTPNCWTVSFLADTDLPTLSTASAFGVGSGSVRFNFYSFSEGAEPVLTSPDFAPVAAGTEIYFDVAGATYTGGEIDEITLEESNDGGLTWNPVVTMTNEPGVGVLNTIGELSGNFVPFADEWASLIYTLSAGTNKVRFHALSDFGNSVYIDNVSVGVQPSARHTAYGASCATPAFTLTSATAPIAGTTTVFDLGAIPLACPSPDPVFHFGVVLVSIGGQDFAGTDLTTYGIDAPGCSLYLSSSDLVLGYIETVPDATVPLDIPAFTPPGFLFYSQAAALICPVAGNTAGVLVSNALRSYVNTF